MLQIQILFIQILLALGHFPVPTLLQDKDGNDIGDNQGREHKMELDHVQITKEMEDKILDEIDQRLADLEDIDVDAKILVRHMDKHPNFQGYESNVNTLNSIEENVLEAYKVELNLMKRRIIGSNHDLKVNDMKDMNKILDMAEETVNQTRDMIDSFIDVHVESEEHQHEHDHEHPDDHDHGDHDSFEDYSDLLSNETEASDYEESLIERTIEKGLKDLDEVRNHRSQMEEHLKDHRDSKDHVNTNSFKKSRSMMLRNTRKGSWTSGSRLENPKATYRWTLLTRLYQLSREPISLLRSPEIVCILPTNWMMKLQMTIEVMVTIMLTTPTYHLMRERKAPRKVLRVMKMKMVPMMMTRT